MPSAHTPIDSRSRRQARPAPRQASPPRRRSWRRWRIVGALVLAAVVVAGADLVGWPFAPGTSSSSVSLVEPGSSLLLPEPSADQSAASSPEIDIEAEVEPEVEEPAPLSLPGDFPASGPQTFRFDATEGEALGGAGTLRRFRVAIEDGIDEEMSEFTAFVDDTLGDDRSWIASGQVRFQRVPDGAPHDFTVYLVTGETAVRMCGEAGLNIRIGGEAYTSCRTVGRVILNLNRWRLSVPEYVEAEVPLETYRQMVLNHELGHELGYGHEACLGPGEPAPVMQQQTLRMDGCAANPWPYLDGQRHAGPPT